MCTSIVLFGIVDAVVEQSNVVMVMIGSPLKIFCFDLNLNLGREEKKVPLIFFSRIRKKQIVRAVDICICIPDAREREQKLSSRKKYAQLYTCNLNF